MTIVSGRFEGDAAESARVFGMPDLQYVAVPWIYRNLDLPRVIEQTDKAIDDLVRELTTVRQVGSRRVEAAERERFKGWDRLEALERMNEQFLLRDWGDGFPLLPPTPEAVERLLKGTCLPPDHVLCDLPPGWGLATVEKVAINAAMAGAKPEQLPVILAALKALSKVDPKVVRQFLMSTGSHASLLLVNGPVAKEIKVNARAAMGPGRENWVNLTIGRSYTLCLKNIGHWYPGLMDMDTLGSVRKFTVCVAENEEASPWEPFHMEKGYRREESVVSLLGTRGEIDVIDQGNTTAEGILKNIASNCGIVQKDLRHGAASEIGRRIIVMVPPDPARVISEGGISKEGAKEFIHFHARKSMLQMLAYVPLRTTEGDLRWLPRHWRWLRDLSDKELDEIIEPVLDRADRYDLLCVGADRAKFQIMPSGPFSPSSENIDQYRPEER
ncbi:MAG: hypothetical protein HYY45_15340 [Deltaproteobacteria bacterium]|nr:hypothetical protein [Deltaproteobacteria bacterium]